MREELNSVLGDREVTWDVLLKLPYTTAVADESMRLRPILPLMMRDATEDDILEGYQVKKGVQLVGAFMNYGRTWSLQIFMP